MTRSLQALRSMTTEQAEDFFAAIPATELVAEVSRTGDEDLRRLVGRPEVRVAAVPGILKRLGEYAIPERLAEVKGVVEFDLGEPKGPREHYAVEFADGELELVEGARAESPDVVVRMSVLEFLRLVSGEHNAGLDYVAGRLDVEGDALLALGVGGVFRVPGSDTVAVDPMILEPSEVAACVATASPDHLRKVMAGGFRPVVLGEIFRRLPDFVNQRKARGVDLTIGFRLSGAAGGAVERYTVHLSAGVATVHEGETSESGLLDRDATIMCDATDFLRLSLGQLSPITGVLRGQLKVRGDRAKALQFSAIMEIPQAPARARR